MNKLRELQNKAAHIFLHMTVGRFLRIFFRMKNTPINFKKIKNKKYIIASNHPTRLDPFLIGAAMPLKEYIKIMPIRYVALDKYFKKWYLRPLLLIMGCISTKPPSGKTCIEEVSNCLNKRETIMIFPVGKLDKRIGNKTPKVGAIVLAKNVKDSQIMPVKISLFRNVSFPNISKRRIKIGVDFKENYRPKKFQEDLQPLANELMLKIEN